MDYTKADVYRRKAIVTKARRQAQYKAGKQLQAAINAYMLACKEARRNGTELPSLSDFTGAK